MEQVSDTSIQNSNYEASRPGESWHKFGEKATGDMMSESRKKGSRSEKLRHNRKQTRRTGILSFVTSEIVSQKRGCDTLGLCSIVIDSPRCSLRHSSWLLSPVCRHGSSGVQSPLSQRTPSNMRLVARCFFFVFYFLLHTGNDASSSSILDGILVRASEHIVDCKLCQLLADTLHAFPLIVVFIFLGDHGFRN